MITFFDVPSKVQDKAWSPTNWKIRYVLNYKQLPYKTQWIEYPDIELFCKNKGIAPTGTKTDGSPFYTLPAIHDDTTGVFLADSIPIAQYLDETYPYTPVVIPIGTEVLMNAFIDACTAKMTAIWPIALPNIVDIFLMHLGLGDIVAWFEKNGGKSFVMGDKPTFCDFVLGATLTGFKVILGEDSIDWKAVSSSHGGRLARFLDDLKDYQAVL
ncbi:hypothetical protein BDQ17DRAFT_1401424 [Cyathus striatus]|nr:hypothetical protein BDQ17DRAFT_1401424 [Cyathus striatus]